MEENFSRSKEFIMKKNNVLKNISIALVIAGIVTTNCNIS